MWSENVKHPKTSKEILKHVHDFISYQDLRMTIGGWFKEGHEPPVMEPPLPVEWKKENQR